MRTAAACLNQHTALPFLEICGDGMVTVKPAGHLKRLTPALVIFTQPLEQRFKTRHPLESSQIGLA